MKYRGAPWSQILIFLSFRFYFVNPNRPIIHHGQLGWFGGLTCGAACKQEKKLGLARTKNLIVRAYYGIYRVTSFQFARTSFLRRTYVVPVVAKAVGAMFAKDRVTEAVVNRTPA